MHTSNSNIPPAKLSLHDDRSYLITGGANGLGLQFARFLTERGARHLILASRSGPQSAEAKALLREMETSGVKIRIEYVDVSDPAQVASLFRPDWPPIAGVIHSAGVVQDRYSYETEMSDFWTVFKPKAFGAWNLHEATKYSKLDFFVMTSSISSLTSLPGQFSYAAANQFLDALAHFRHSLGLPGLSLNLSLLGDYAGMTARVTARLTRVVNALNSQGFYPVALPAVLAAFEKAVLQGTAQWIVADIDWALYKSSHPQLHREGAFMDLGNEDTTDLGSRSRVSLSRLSGPELLQSIIERLCLGLAKIIGLDPTQIETTEKIDQYAFDSLTFTQIRGLILREFDFPYGIARLYQGPSDVDGTSLPDGLYVASKWLLRGKSVLSPQARVICFHGFGSGALSFAPFLLDPPPNLEMMAVQLPGRETRIDEPAPSSMTEVVNGIVSELPSSLGTKDIFWAHSFGGIVAFETLRVLRQLGRPLPQLVVCGSMPPQLQYRWQKRDLLRQMLAAETKPEYLLAISRYIEDADFVRAVLPTMKKDASLFLGYEYKAQPNLDIPITAFAARMDDLVYRDEVETWTMHAKSFRLIDVKGDHWFLYRNKALIMEILQALVL